MDRNLITPVILCGGAGTRLWPISRMATPKQLHRLIGAETMLQSTGARVRQSEMYAAPVVVTSWQYAAEVEAQLHAVSIEPGVLVLEPAARNTAAAITLAALQTDPEALLLVLPSDHVITHPSSFQTAVRIGSSLAKDGNLVTFGIRPDRPETGYGYIRRGRELAPGAFRAERFVEKPDLRTAESYIAEGTYDWNGGIFLFRAERLLEEMALHAPDILKGVKAASEAGVREDRRFHPDRKLFATVRSQSIDHAIMERAERVAVIPTDDMGWSDVGSWDALYELARSGEEGNALFGTVIAKDTRNCLIRGDGPTVVTVGVEDLVIVATPDAVLILPRGDTQRAKEVVDDLAVSRANLL